MTSNQVWVGSTVASARREVAGARAAGLVRGKANGDEDLLDMRYDGVGDAGDSIGQHSATEHGCSEVSP